MAARTTVYAEQISEVTKTSTSFSDVVSATHTPGDNETWLYIATCILRYNATNSDGMVNFVHDTAAINMCKWNREPKDTTDLASLTGIYIHTYGAAPGSNTISIEYAGENGTVIVGVQQARIWGIKLESSDKYSNGNTADTTDSTAGAFTDVLDSSVSFTPASQGDYYIIGTMEYRCSSSTSVANRRRVDIDGSPEEQCDATVKDVSNYVAHAVMYKKTFTATSHTIKWQIDTASSTFSVAARRGRFAVLRADGFEATYWGEDRTRSSGTEATYQDELSLNPTIASSVKHAVLGSWMLDNNNTTLSSQGKLYDGTTDFQEVIVEANVANDEWGCLVVYEATLTSGSGVTWKTQRRSETTGHTTGIDESAIAILQIAAAVAPAPPNTLGANPLPLLGVGRKAA